MHLGTPELGDRFFRRRWPEAVAIADPEGALYDEFEVERARWTQLFGLRVLLRGVGAALSGNLVGRPGSDVMRMPAAFLVHHGNIVWAQEPAHVADHPNLAAVHAMALMLTERDAKAEAGPPAAALAAQRSAASRPS